ncbi:MAG: TonB-dependent receptor [Proteobacteria bacterium]|nr:TonB-dependent receptor [Pseudomonadota bacterium]
MASSNASLGQSGIAIMLMVLCLSLTPVMAADAADMGSQPYLLAESEEAGAGATREAGDQSGLDGADSPSEFTDSAPDALESASDDEAKVPSPPADTEEADSTPAADIEEVIVISRQQENTDRMVSQYLDAEEIFKIPALRDDAIGAINTFAGVASLQGNFNGPPSQGFYFRGSNQNDNQIEIDGLAVDYVYHLGGPFSFSVINGRLIERLKFYPSNPGIEYPNVNGGVIDVGLRQPPLEGFNQNYDIGTLSTGVMIEGGFGNGKDGYWLAFRRSYIDFFLNASGLAESAPDGETTILRFPEFYDIQGRWYRELDAGFMDFTIISSEDKIAIRFGSDVAEGDPLFQGDLGSRESFIVAGWRLQYEPGADHLLRTQVNYRFPKGRFIIGRQGANDINPGASFGVQDISRIVDISIDHTWQPKSQFNLRYGLDFSGENTDVLGYIFLPPSPDTGVPSTGISTSVASSVDEKIFHYSQELFVDLSYRPLESLVLEVAGRTYHSQRTSTPPVGRQVRSYLSGFSPRFHMLYTVSDDVTLYYRWGDFIQIPQGEELNVGIGNPQTLDLIKSRSNLLGLRYNILGRQLVHDLSIELWHKDLRGLVIPDDADCNRCLSNKGVGLAYGVDVEWTFSGGRDHYFRLVYSWTTTSRRNGPGEPPYPYTADQPHTFKLLYSGPIRKDHRRLRWGFFMTLNTGQPYTPVVARQVADVGGGELFFQPQFGPINSKTVPAFLQLNLDLSYTSESGITEYKFSLLSFHDLFYRNVTEFKYDESYENLNAPDEIGSDLLIPSFVIIFRI